MDERVVEYPWIIAQLPAGSATLLDAGSTLNHPFALDHPVVREKRITILTLGPERHCFCQRGISDIYDDLRAMPFRDKQFDVITCISTLEHVGCDNSYYTGDPLHREQRTRDFVKAIEELRRVLKPGGLLLLTVPFGKQQHLGNAQQFDYEMLTDAISAFGDNCSVSSEFFGYTSGGWKRAEASDCDRCEYVQWINLHPAARGVFPMQVDGATAARAVACVRLTVDR